MKKTEDTKTKSLDIVEKAKLLKTPPPKPQRLKVSTENIIHRTNVEFMKKPTTNRTEREIENVAEKIQQRPKKHLHFQSPLVLRRIRQQCLPAESDQPRRQQQRKEQQDECNIKYATILLSSQTCNKKIYDTRYVEKATTTTTKTNIKSSNAVKSTSKYRTLEEDEENEEYASSNVANILAKGEEVFSVTFPPAATLKRTLKAKNRLAYGCNSFMYACQNGDIVEVLEQLRSKPERIRQRDSRNKNALHYCAAQSAEKRDLVAAASIAVAAPELLESADEDGFTPLHLAVIQGNLAMVNLLLANKADVNAVDNEGHSVVHWATVCGEVEALRSVLSAGANVSIADINGGSPLHYAAQMCGANYDGKLGQGNSTKLALEILGILLAHPRSSVDIQDKDGRQPLLWAASAGSAKAIIALVKADARVESADKDGLTALHCAASRGHTECIDTLISLCGAPTDLIDSNGCTALHYAVTLGHADATSRLLDLEADPNRQDRKGRTPAHCGCSKGQFETVKMLKERGANLWLRNAKGDLPVHEAASSGRRELVAWLLEQKPKHVNTTSNDGRSLLHIAAANDYTDMCKMLLDIGADVNAIYRNTKGVVNTPLDCALQRGNRSTAKFLQSNGGLPAGKLRLAARRANPFQEATTDVVRPLKYVEKEEIHDLSNSKKYVVYLKRSDSDGGGAGDGSCSCTEQTYKREQRFAHKCRRHQKSSLRRRTSSCEELKHNEQSDICRSKSNIEIRRKRSRERYASSSEWEGDEDDEDSCENCCYHKRQKQKVFQRRRTTSLRRSKDIIDSDEEPRKSVTEKDSAPEKQMQVQVQEAATERKEEKEIDLQATHTESRPASKTSTQSRPQSASKRRTPQTPQQSAPKEGTFIKSPPTSANVRTEAEKVDDSLSTHALELTDEDDAANKTVETVTTQVDVHRSEDGDAKIEEQSINPRDDENQENVKESLKKQASDEVEQVLQMAATAVSSECKNDDFKETAQQDNPLELNENLNENAKTVTSKIEKSENEILNANLTTESITVTEVQPQTQQKTASIPAEETAKETLPTEEAKPSTQVIDVTPTSNVSTSEKPQTATSNVSEELKKQREQEPRRSFTLLPSDSAEDDDAEQTRRKSSFQILKSDESNGELDAGLANDIQVFKIMPEHNSIDGGDQTNLNYDDDDYEEEDDDGIHYKVGINRHGVGNVKLVTPGTPGVLNVYDNTNGRKRRLKRRVKSGGSKSRNNWKAARESQHVQQHSTKDQDSGFEPSPRATKTKIPAPRNIYTAYTPRRSIYTTLDGRSCSSRLEHRKPGDKGACDMTAVTRSIQRNIRRYYMERKIFQHLLELKSLQIRSNKLNEAVLVKRAVDDYHRSCASLGGETGARLRRYTFSEYSFKNFELFLYETLKALQKPGTYNFQNINEVYEEAERRLSPDYNAYEKALHCTNKTHRCPHAIHAYTGIPCAAYIPMMNHHTMPKFGFGPYKKTGVGSFYLPKILTKSNSCGDGGAASGASCSGKMALELTHGKSKQLISLPSDKLDSNKRYYVTFTVKETSGATAGDTNVTATTSKQQNNGNAISGKEL